MGTALLTLDHQLETAGINGLNGIYKITDTPMRLTEVEKRRYSAAPSPGLRHAFESTVHAHAEQLADTKLYGRKIKFYIQKNLRGGDRHMLTIRIPLGTRIKDVFNRKETCDITFCENIKTGHIYRLNQKVNLTRFK